MGLEDTRDEYEYVRFLRSRNWDQVLDGPPSIEEWRRERVRAAQSRGCRAARPLRSRVTVKGLGRSRTT